jgi:hypothetical protein
VALTLGRGLSLALRKANADYVETQRLAGGTVSLPSGDEEHGIDYATTHKFTVNGFNMYVPHDVVTANPNFEIAGQVGGGSYSSGNGGGQAGATTLPTTNLFLYPSSDSETTYVQDWHWFYLRGEVNRTRVTTFRNLNITCLTTPDFATYTAYPTGLPPPARESDSCFVRHTATNDYATVDMRGQPGDVINFVNVHVQPGAGWVGMFTTSSGAYTQINGTDCVFRGNVGCIFLFGAGASALQDGKRSTWRRCKFKAAYMQGPGPEIANRGGNGDYNHPVVGADFYFCEMGDETGSAVEALYERGYYGNGGTTGYAPDHNFEDCIFWENNYEGQKLQAGRRPDGTRGRYYFKRCDFRSLKWALDNNEGDTLIQNCTFRGGLVTGSYDATEPTTRTIIEDSTFEANYARPPSQYEGGNNDTLTNFVVDHVTLRRCTVTWTSARYAITSSIGAQSVLEDTTVTAVGAGAAGNACYLGGKGGRSSFVRSTFSGQTRPFYLQRPEDDNAHVYDYCDFSGCTLGFRVTFDQDGTTPGFLDNKYRTVVKNTTKLPDVVPIVTGTRPQAWQFYAGDRVATIASAATLSAWQSSDRDTITGSATINTVNFCGLAAANMLVDGAIKCLRVGPTASWKLGTSGNVTPLNTNARTPGALVLLQYSVALAKWVEVPDTTPPVFDGVADVTSLSPVSLGLSWTAARDLGTETAAITYLIYASTTSGGQNYAVPTATVVGSTSTTLLGLTPGATYYIVVRARDAAGNTTTNINQNVGTDVPDVTPPTFAGVASVAQTGVGQITANWAAASDDFTPVDQIVYNLYSSTRTRGQDFSTPTATVTGQLSASFTGALPGHRYFVIVRAADGSGNQETNTVELSVRIPSQPLVETVASVPQDGPLIEDEASVPTRGPLVG